MYEEYKDADDIMGSILEKMELKRSRKSVVQKMIEIGIIDNKFEVKKKGKRSRKSKSQISQDSDIENGELLIKTKKNNLTALCENHVICSVFTNIIVIEEPRREESNRNSGSDDSSSSSDSGSDSDSEPDNEADNMSDAGNAGPVGPYDEEKVSNLGKELMKKGMV